jgi:hypothetical protein
MTASSPPAAQRDVQHQTLRTVLLLVLGERSVPDDSDWAALYELAAEERVAALAWHRNGTLIRSQAPQAVVERWRSLAMRTALQVETLLDVVAGTVTDLRNAGVHAIVLKGAPLAQRLYGDPGVRPLADCDLYVPPPERELAAEVLARAGWTSRTGEPPCEETFERWAGGQRNVIEVHSSLIDDALLAHIHMPVEVMDAQVGRVSLPAHAGDYLPAYLAAHLAKHETSPLLWIVDLHTLWSSLPESARARARDGARRVGLERHLAWALALAAHVPRAAAGEPAALADLASLRRATGDLGRVRRLIALSASPVHAARVMTGRLWPEEWRDGWWRAPNYVLRRGAGWIARRLQLTGSPAATESTRALSVDELELTSLLEETLGRGLAIWIRPRGTSMQPAIPPSAAAHIVPPSSRVVKADDIVLARLPHGRFVLHRVQHLWDHKVQLKGDAMRRRDDVVEQSAIVGICDRVEVGGVLYRAEDRPRDPVALLASAARSRLRRLVAPRQA